MEKRNMTTKWLNSIRWKFLITFIASIGATGIFLLLGQLLASYLLQHSPYNIALKWVINNVGSQPVLIMSGCLLFIFSYYQLSRPIVSQFTNISNGLQEMANGNFAVNIQIDSSDELGDIAQRINGVATELDSYLQEITHGLGEIATGELQHEIPVRSAQMLGNVAESINQMSRQLSQSIEEERKAEKTKSDLITGVSHDLRTPLTSILGFLELIEKDRYHDEVEIRYYVNIAYEKALDLKKLIDDLFEYTRINNGLPLQVQELHITSFIRQLVEEFVPSLEKAGLECRLHVEKDTLNVLADGDRLVRAYENLLSNAIQYGRKGKYIDIEIQSLDGQAIIRIINYGEPIPERDLPFIFDRFYRVEQSRSKETGGTGLGLAITKSIIEVHGGQIAAYSNPYQTTFETILPAVSKNSSSNGVIVTAPTMSRSSASAR